MSTEPPGAGDDGGDLVGPDLRRTLEAVVDELAGRDDSGDLAARVEWLIDVLVLRGHLAPGHRKLIARIKAERSTVQLAHYRDKHAVRGADVDCASLLPLCRARCCSFAVSLSPQDVREGKLPWDLHVPYMLPKNPETGYCGCMDGAGRCGVYADRPGTCRAYDCRHDPRVWEDFDRRIPAPLSPALRPPVTSEPDR